MKQKINIGIVGLGRLGYQYASNLAHSIGSANLVAVCSQVQRELDQARDQLDVPFLFTEYEAMLALEEIDAVFVLSSTDMHAEHIILALQAGKHVFSEKPLALTENACKEVEREASKYPNQKCIVGFVRRYDPSYKYAKEKISSGQIGKPYLFRSQTVDKDSESGFQLEYVANSGGIFHDYNVHDIDLARWLMGAEFASVHAIGGAFKHKEFAAIGDADNVLTLCTLSDGSMATISASRTALHGHDTYTEIVGTEGSLLIGRPAMQNRVEIYDQHGARRECVATFWDRFEEAFLIMAKDFIDAILENQKLELSIQDAVKATEVAIAFSESFRTGELVHL